MEDFGIGHADGLPAFGGAIDDGKAQGDADLHGGEAIAGHGLHRVDHVGPDGADVVGDRLDRGGWGFQDGVGPWQAGADGHVGRPAR